MGRRCFWKRLLIILTFVSLPGGLLSCGQAESGPKAWIDSPQEGAFLQAGSPVTVIFPRLCPGGGGRSDAVGGRPTIPP